MYITERSQRFRVQKELRVRIGRGNGKSASRRSLIDLPQARLNEALAADAIACSVSAV